MEYDFSSGFVKPDAAAHDFQVVWAGLCRDLLIAEFGPKDLIRLDTAECGLDLLDRTTGTGFRFQGIENPQVGELAVEPAVASLQLAEAHREELGWRRYVLATNVSYSPEAIETLTSKCREISPQAHELEFFDQRCWSALCAKHEQALRNWFDYRVLVTPEAVIQAFRTAGYYDRFVQEYEVKMKATEFHVVLTNNRTPLELDIPFASDLSVENLLDVGKILLQLKLDSTPFPDLGTSARLSLSITIDRVAQSFKKTLSEIGIRSGGELQLWVQVIWQDESDNESQRGREEHRLSDLLRRESKTPAHALHFSLHATTFSNFTYSFFERAKISAPKPPADVGEESVFRKVGAVRSTIWQAATSLLPATRTRWRPHNEAVSQPVRLGATAPKTAAAGSSFMARFVAYHPDLEAQVLKQLDQLDPGANHRLDHVRAIWKLGTKVKVRAYGKDLAVEPKIDQFCWGGEKHILDFQVTVNGKATGKRVLKFDAYIDGLRVGRIWLEIPIVPGTQGEMQTASASTPRTAFASYSTQDRSRVLDRVASLEIHTGIQVFLDCISLRPNAKWRKVLSEMILGTEQLLLFWSRAARDSHWVSEEWRLAFESKGIDAIEVHPLETYDEAPLPAELADLIQGSDVKMVIRAHEKRRTNKSAQ
jgi:hypothetical protein